MRTETIVAIIAILWALGWFYKNLEKKIEEKNLILKRGIEKNKQDTLRITLKYLMKDNIKEIYSEIFKLYDEYKQLWGNGYIDGDFVQRKKENLLDK
jgi:hypothetical protein